MPQSVTTFLDWIDSTPAKWEAPLFVSLVILLLVAILIGYTPRAR